MGLWVYCCSKKPDIVSLPAMAIPDLRSSHFLSQCGRLDLNFTVTVM